MRMNPHAPSPDRLQLPRRLVPRRPNPGAFVHPIVSDTMAPTYLPNQSSVICVPVDEYSCEGVYLIDGELFRCQRDGSHVKVWRDNPAWTEYRVAADLFNASQLALVVADITARNAIGMDLMQGAAR